MRIYASLVLTACSVTPSFAAAGLSPDEVAIRAAYAAVELRSQLYSVHESYSADQFSTDRRLSIQISDLQAGAVSDIVTAALPQLVTVPSGRQTLNTTPGSWSVNDQVIGSNLSVGPWRPGNTRYGDGFFDHPLSEVLAHSFGASYTRYVRFTVLLSAGGKESSYKALALFRDDVPGMRTLDYILGPPEGLIGKGLVADFINLPTRLPYLTEAKRAKLAELFDGATVSGDCNTDTLTSLCCDPATKVCGIPALAFGKR